MLQTIISFLLPQVVLTPEFFSMIIPFQPEDDYWCWICKCMSINFESNEEGPVAIWVCVDCDRVGKPGSSARLDSLPPPESSLRIQCVLLWAGFKDFLPDVPELCDLLRAGLNRMLLSLQFFGFYKVVKFKNPPEPSLHFEVAGHLLREGAVGDVCRLQPLAQLCHSENAFVSHPAGIRG